MSYCRRRLNRIFRLIFPFEVTIGIKRAEGVSRPHIDSSIATYSGRRIHPPYLLTPPFKRAIGINRVKQSSWRTCINGSIAIYCRGRFHSPKQKIFPLESFIATDSDNDFPFIHPTISIIRSEGNYILSYLCRSWCKIERTCFYIEAGIFR